MRKEVRIGGGGCLCGSYNKVKRERKDVWVLSLL